MNSLLVSTLPAKPPTEVDDEPFVEEASVGMGQIAWLYSGGIGRSVLGSCVGLVLYDPVRRLAAKAHIVLPAADRRLGTPGKFADTAVAYMLERLRRRGCDPTKMVAKLAGGANMFVSKGPFQIGLQNIDAVHEQLEMRNIRLLGEHVGGKAGRRTTFDCRSGELTVEVLGAAPVVL